MERLSKIGQVLPKHSSQLSFSKIGIGFEKLDRAVFDPNKAYDKVAALGVKWVRLQSGWQRTEKVKGCYDFAWLDEIVDQLRARGCVPWLCLCYGNELYNPEAKTVFGAVGCPPIRNEDQKKGWHEYVRALTAHFKGRVEWYEVWNEPEWTWKDEDLKIAGNGTEYGRFVVDTAAAVREGDPDAKVIGGSLCTSDMFFLHAALEAGMGQVIDALTFHEYTPDERRVQDRVNWLRALTHRYNPNVKIIQGESGSQSRSDGCGAMSGGAWTPEKQAKQCVRHTVMDLMSDVYFTSFFTTVDMIEALMGRVGDKSSYLDYGYFGVLGADFDENGFSTGDYTPKPAYYALQTLCSVFGETIETAVLPVSFRSNPSRRALGSDIPALNVVSGGFRRPNGSYALAYWNPTDLMTTSYEGTTSLSLAGLPDDISLIDLKDGSVYRLPDSMISKQEDDCKFLLNLPIKDYPLLLTFGDFAEIQK